MLMNKKLGLGLAALTLSVSGAATAQTVVIADAAGDYIDDATLATGWSYLYSDAAIGGTEVDLTPETVIGGGSGGRKLRLRRHRRLHAPCRSRVSDR